jgi:transcriptional regulator with XRE-family HTH domain
VLRRTPEEITAAVVAKLRDRRIVLGLSQNELSQRAGLSRTGLRHIGAGDVLPSFVNVLRLAVALDVAFDDLIPGEGGD